MNFKRNQIISGIAILVLVIAFVAISWIFRPKSPESESVNVNHESIASEVITTISTTTLTATSTTSTTNQNGTIKKPAPKTAPGAITQSYADALKEYSASGYRFQFVNCKATPGILTIKKGATFMIDNRDNVTHKIKVGASTYTVGAYGYVIATAKTVGLNYVTCDGGGAARIEVQP